MKLEILNGHLVDPANDTDQIADVFIADGKVVAIGKPPAAWQADLTINASGRLVLPGLVELSASLRQPGQEHKATIRTETTAAAASGVTSLACLPTTKPRRGLPCTGGTDSAAFTGQRALQRARDRSIDEGSER